MESKLPTSNFGHEQMPMGYGQGIEHGIPMLPNPEVSVERSHEQFEQHGETAPAVATIAPTLPAPIAIPLPVVHQADDSQSTPVSDGLPLVANDDDLIEKEWVDKAKKIIVETKDDPYRREQEVGKLQADYLRKRYGKELGASQ